MGNDRTQIVDIRSPRVLDESEEKDEMNSKIRSLLRELREGIEHLYGPRLRGVYLFGSYARGEEDAESDVDLLIVLDEVSQSAQEVERTGHLISDLSLKFGISVSRVFVSERDWLERDTPFLANAREEAIAA